MFGGTTKDNEMAKACIKLLTLIEHPGQAEEAASLARAFGFALPSLADDPDAWWLDDSQLQASGEVAITFSCTTTIHERCGHGCGSWPVLQFGVGNGRFIRFA